MDADSWPRTLTCFPVDQLAVWDAVHPGNAVRALFDRWRPPGQRAVALALLRLRLGDGYLEFYVRGQLLAKLTLGQSGPRLSVPLTYVAGRARNWLSDTSSSLQGFQEFDSDGLADPTMSSLVSEWISTAETYASAEHRFVDDLIAANPGVLNLELELPQGDVHDPAMMPSPTVLLIAQFAKDEPPSICLWQARSASNPDLRSRNNEPPTILTKFAAMQQCLTEQNHISWVQRISQETAIQLLALRAVFSARDTGHLQCESIWKAVAARGAPVFAPELGLVIGNYWPQGYRETIASGRMAQHAAKLIKNRQRARFALAGIWVHEIGQYNSISVLPFI